jgi:hypothetical protein
MITTEGIRATGLYLLEVLNAEKSVRYNRFYNAVPETENRLVEGALPFVAHPESCNAEDLREEGHVMLDFAAWQLEDLGIVRITFLHDTLIDGEPDFQIEITEKGEHALAEGLRFAFRQPEYSITATPASEWLISFLEGGGGETLTLRQVMKYGHSEAEVVIHDDCGNEYHLGTGTYAWAFEVSLWHHARAGHIVPAAETAEQEKVWSDFVRRTGRPSCPDVDKSQPHWEIPFRLADTVYAGKVTVKHVGTVN